MNHEMQKGPSVQGADSELESFTQLLLLPDGRLLVHNLTPAMARILQKLDPGDGLIRQRSAGVLRDASSASHS